MCSCPNPNFVPSLFAEPVGQSAPQMFSTAADLKLRPFLGLLDPNHAGHVRAVLDRMVIAHKRDHSAINERDCRG